MQTAALYNKHAGLPIFCMQRLAELYLLLAPCTASRRGISFAFPKIYHKKQLEAIHSTRGPAAPSV